MFDDISLIYINAHHKLLYRNTINYKQVIINLVNNYLCWQLFIRRYVAFRSTIVSIQKWRYIWNEDIFEMKIYLNRSTLYLVRSKLSIKTLVLDMSGKLMIKYGTIKSFWTRSQTFQMGKHPDSPCSGPTHIQVCIQTTSRPTSRPPICLTDDNAHYLQAIHCMCHFWPDDPGSRSTTHTSQWDKWSSRVWRVRTDWPLFRSAWGLRRSEHTVRYVLSTFGRTQSDSSLCEVLWICI